jgi:Ca-activated chloride channel family protein
MSFAHSEVLWFLLIVPILASIALIRFKKKYPFFKEMLAESQRLHFHRRYDLSTLFFIASVACSIIALASPRWGEKLQPVYYQGLDVVLAFDVSNSMNVSDVVPSRLDRAKGITRELIRQSPGVRFAITIGKGQGVLAVPLTDDAEALDGFLRYLASDMITSPGTNLEQLVEASLQAFPANNASHKRIILFTDGETLSGTVQTMTNKAIDEQVPIVTVGLGTTAGQYVPDPSNPQEFLTLPNGEPVLSQLREKDLTLLAEQTGGIYVSGADQTTTTRLLEYIQSLANAKTTQEFRQEVPDRSFLFLLCAVIFFVLMKWIES